MTHQDTKIISNKKFSAHPIPNFFAPEAQNFYFTP